MNKGAQDNHHDHDLAERLRALGAIVKLTKKGRVHTVDLRPLAVAAGNAEVASLAGLARLQELFLAGTAVDDEAISRLGEFSKLAMLDLQETAVSDAVLDDLRALGQLKLLLLTGTKITRLGISELRKEMIGTRIVCL